MSALTEAVVREAETFGHTLKTSPTDRRDVPIDYRFLELLLEVAEDPEVAVGSFAGRVRVGLVSECLGCRRCIVRSAAGSSRNNQTHWTTWKKLWKVTQRGEGSIRPWLISQNRLLQYWKTKQNEAKC